jgi:DUF1009 family protein
MGSRIAILAGAGLFPLHVAQEAKRHGHTVIVLGMKGWADPALAVKADAYEEVAVGQLSRLIERLRQLGARKLIMAGKVTKDVLWRDRGSFDLEMAGVLRHVRGFSAPQVLGAVGKRLAREGITLLDSSTFLRGSLCPAGSVTRRRPTAAQQKDIRLGFEAARALAALDIGQTVAVKDGVVIAVEALEGTDAAIRRAHELAGEGLVVVKAGGPKQDRRFDLPVVGPETVQRLRDARAACLAVEAGTTLLLDRDAVIAAADAAGLCLIGVPPPARPRQRRGRDAPFDD